MKDISDREFSVENGLPEPFVESMRTLFDILDDQHSGQVKLSDIERRWREDEDCCTSGLPAGVLDSLRVVTPSDGYLSFPQFCKGLQLCLLRSKSGNPKLVPPSFFSDSNTKVQSGLSSRGKGIFHPPIAPHHDFTDRQTRQKQASCEQTTSVPLVSPNRVCRTHPVGHPSWPAERNKKSPSEQPPDKSLESDHYGKTRKKQLDDALNTAFFEDRSYKHSRQLSADSYNNSNNVNIAAAFSRGTTNYANSLVMSRQSPRKMASNFVNRAEKAYGDVKYKNGYRSEVRMGTGGGTNIYSTGGGANIYGSAGAPAIYGTSTCAKSVSDGPPKPPRASDTQESSSSLALNDYNSLAVAAADKLSGREPYPTFRNVESAVNKLEALSSGNSATSKQVKIYEHVRSKSKTGSSEPQLSGYFVAPLPLSSRYTPSTTHEGGQSEGESRPPPPPARSVYSLQRSQTHALISTHSLERDSRGDARRAAPDTNKIRARRGGSLERLLDSNHTVLPSTLPYYGSYATIPPPPPPAQRLYHYRSRENSKDAQEANYEFPWLNGHPVHYHRGAPAVPYSQGGDGDTSPRKPTVTPAAVDHRLTMSSYAWIRGEDSSSSEGNIDAQRFFSARLSNTELHDVGFAAAPAAVTYADTAHTATVTATADFTAAASEEDLAEDAAGKAGKAVVLRKSKRREARRHTLQNGLDFAAVRRAGELEAERDMLHQGLQVVEQARHWYRTQLHKVLVSLHNPADATIHYDSEMQQRKLHYQLARITEINTQLTALMNAEQMPEHLALATTTSSGTVSSDSTGQGRHADPCSEGTTPETSIEKSKMETQIRRLREQNQQLTEEVSQKSQHISVLEKDKMRLLQELFQSRAISQQTAATGVGDSTFM